MQGNQWVEESDKAFYLCDTGQMGFEPTTSAVTGQRSKPLNYYPLKRGGRLEFCITNKRRALLQ